MDSPVLVRPAGNGPEGETGTTVRYQKTGGFLKPEGALIPPPKDAVQHRMGVEVHELGYEKCTCPKVQSGQVTDLDQCECSRQSILYILSCLEPNSKFEVEILETILRGAEHCRFQITKY